MSVRLSANTANKIFIYFTFAWVRNCRHAVPYMEMYTQAYYRKWIAMYEFIRMSHAKLHCNRLTTVQHIRDHASLVFGDTVYIVCVGTFYTCLCVLFGCILLACNILPSRIGAILWSLYHHLAPIERCHFCLHHRRQSYQYRLIGL